jgi:hypothetical protein
MHAASGIDQSEALRSDGDVEGAKGKRFAWMPLFRTRKCYRVLSEFFGNWGSHSSLGDVSGGGYDGACGFVVDQAIAKPVLHESWGDSFSASSSDGP